MPSTKDTAAMLGISRQRVLALIQSGTLNAIVTDKGYSAVHFRRRGFYPSGFFVALIPIIAPETDKGYSVTGESFKVSTIPPLWCPMLQLLGSGNGSSPTIALCLRSIPPFASNLS